MVTGGANLGKIGVITNRERERDILALLMCFMWKTPMATALPVCNIFVIGQGNKPWISLP
jgi:small subunit ribosomal protein S4e